MQLTVSRYDAVICVIMVWFVNLSACASPSIVSKYAATNSTTCPINACDLARLISDSTTIFDAHRFGRFVKSGWSQWP